MLRAEPEEEIPFSVVYEVVTKDFQEQYDALLTAFRSGETLSNEQIFQFLIFAIQKDTVNDQMEANVRGEEYLQTEFAARLKRNKLLIAECRQQEVSQVLLEVIQTQLTAVNHLIEVMNRPEDNSTESTKQDCQDEKKVLELILERFTSPEVATELE